MNLNEQIDELATGVDQLIDTARAAAQRGRTEIAEATGPGTAAAAVASTDGHSSAHAHATASATPAGGDAPESISATASVGPATLHIARPSQNEITMTINGQTVTLHPEQVSQLIEELAHARASMALEQPHALPPGWRFVSTKNPMIAVQKQASGDRLLVARHTGYGWVPFTFSPEQAIELYMLLTQQ
jgi:hypothetical protein